MKNNEDKRLLGEYFGLVFKKYDENGEPEFTGTEQQLSEYREIENSEVFSEEDKFDEETGRLFFHYNGERKFLN